MRQFVNHEAMIAAAEMEVREEARRHPDSARRPYDPEFAVAVADARKRLRGELLAMRIEQVAKAANARDLWEAGGSDCPSWARNTLAWAATPAKITALYEFDEEDDANDVDEAIAAIRSALR
jgi:hypothetical protein